MKNLLTAAVLFAGLITSAQADGWIMSPYKQAGWSPDFTLAVTAGPMDFDIAGMDVDTALGVQLSLNCPWFSPPSGTIRQQFNYNTFDNNNVTINTLEMNPHWYGSSGKLSYGAGPGLGYVWVKPDVGLDDSMWAFQLSADVEYRHGVLFAGIGTRYQFTSGGDADNLLTQVKFGVNF